EQRLEIVALAQAVKGSVLGQPLDVGALLEPPLLLRVLQQRQRSQGVLLRQSVALALGQPRVLAGHRRGARINAADLELAIPRHSKRPEQGLRLPGRQHMLSAASEGVEAIQPIVVSLALLAEGKDSIPSLKGFSVIPGVDQCPGLLFVAEQETLP